NSVPDSMLKSQKVRDRCKRKKMQTMTADSYRKSELTSPTSQQEPYYDNIADLQEDWKEVFRGDEDEDELFQIVQTTLGRNSTPTLQADYISDDCSRDVYYGYARDSPASSVTCSRNSYAFSTSTKSSRISKRAIDCASDVFYTRNHLFTQPEKEFTPRILKTNKKSILSNCKYYNPPPKTHKRKTAKESPRNCWQNNSSDQCKPEDNNYTEFVKEASSFISSPPTTAKSVDNPKVFYTKSLKGDDAKNNATDKTTHHSKENISLEEDIPDSQKNTLSSRHKPRLNSTDNADNQTSEPKVSAKDPLDLYRSYSNTKVLNEINKSNECDYVSFMKHVTEDILLKGLFTNRAIQQVFEFHIMKHRGKLDEEKMRRMVMNFLKDIGIQPENDTISPNMNSPNLNKESTPTGYSGANLTEIQPQGLTLNKELDEDHKSNLEKLTMSMTHLDVSEDGEKNLVKETNGSEVSLARKQRHQKQSSMNEKEDDNDNSENRITFEEDKPRNRSSANRISFNLDNKKEQKHKPVPRPRQKDSLPNPSQNIKASVKVLEVTEENTSPHHSSNVRSPRRSGLDRSTELGPSSPTPFVEDNVAPPSIEEDKVVPQYSSQESMSSSKISVDEVTETKTLSEPIKCESQLTLSTSSNMVVDNMESNTVGSELLPDLKDSKNLMESGNSSPEAPHDLPDIETGEQNIYDLEDFESNDSDTNSGDDF
ncbi:hypothetical protein Ahia01_000418800, partial [Argonauta hians]